MTEFERMQTFSYLDGVADGLNESRKDIVEELEKIKAEIMSIGNWREITEVSNGYVVECLNIVDKHIAELKGE